MTYDEASIEHATARLRKAQQAKNMRRAEVTKRAGISKNHYTQIERAEKPTVSTFSGIIRATRVAAREILGD